MLGSGIATWQICCRIVVSSSVAGPYSGVCALTDVRMQTALWISFAFASAFVATVSSLRPIKQSTVLIVTLRYLHRRERLMPGFHYSVAVLPLPFRRSAVVKFRCSAKIR